ncbi:MAG TPA: YHS domain-containing protein [Vicinamibacteria bacterium]|nr:YHS domain-containing protein [Vicinamibacteria bacterium]
MIIRFLYFVLLAILARLVFRTLSDFVGSRSRAQVNGSDAPRRTLHKGRMVRDPVCGLHLPEGRALTAVQAGERFHFCSERCRAAFLDGGR